VFVNVSAYADDIVLVALSWRGRALQQLLDKLQEHINRKI